MHLKELIETNHLEVAKIFTTVVNSKCSEKIEDCNKITEILEGDILLNQASGLTILRQALTSVMTRKVPTFD